jgi:tetratricopeptide (TPR) repeat protein
VAESESLFQEATAMQKKFLGNDHPNLVATLTNLARVLREEGKLSESEATLQRVLEIRRKHGDAHPSVTASLLELTNRSGAEENPERLEAIRE